MLIINQFRNAIINFNRINFIKIESDENKFDIAINYDSDYWDVMGTYDSYERAQEILVEISQEFRKVARVAEQNSKEQNFIVYQEYMKCQKSRRNNDV